MHPDLKAFIDIVWRDIPHMRSFGDVYSIYTRHRAKQRGDNAEIDYDTLRHFLEPLLAVTDDLEGANRQLERDFEIYSIVQYGLYEERNTNTVLKRIVDAGKGFPSELANTFFFFVRDGYVTDRGSPGKSSTESSEPEYCRLYLSLDDKHYTEAAMATIGILLEQLSLPDGRMNGFSNFKIMGPRRGGRRDNVVAYFSSTSAREAVTDAVLKARRKFRRPLITKPLPFCIENKADGVGWADEPPPAVKLSFGEYLSDAIWNAAFEEDGETGDRRLRETYPDFSEAIRMQFAMAGINIDAPWAEIGTFKPRKRSVGVGERRAATAAATQAATEAAGVPLRRRTPVRSRPRANAVSD